MKKLPITLLAGSLVLGGAGIAQANEIFDYAGGGIAIQDLDGFDDGMALVLTAGKNMADVHENFYLEGEFTYTLSSPEFDTFGGSIEVDLFTLGGYGAFVHPLNDQFNLKGRAGLVYWDSDVDPSSILIGDDDGIELSFGFGAEYMLNDEMKITFDYTIIESDLTHLGLGVKVAMQ